MDLRNGNIRSIYLRYLGAAFGSAMITSIYGMVDMAMVGQYHGPEGTAALAVVAPIWNIIYSLGLLTGIGGSVLFGTIRGQGEGKERKSNEYFTVSVILSVILALLVWVIVGFFDRPLLQFFGANESMMTLARNYVRPIKVTVPLFLFSQMLAAYLRNDGAPTLATVGVLAGGIFNIFGDYFFVFTCDMGSYGAGVATAMGSVITIVTMLTHFFSKKNTLYLVRPTAFLSQAREVLVNGFASFFLDVAMGILTILFNRQIVTRLGGDALAVYGVIVNVSTIVQCCAYSVGQAAQPLLSVNYGAKQMGRIRETLRCALLTAAAFSVFWVAICELAPNLFIHIFMSPTEAVLTIAPAIIRTYAISFVLLPLNIFSTYYFQAVMQSKSAFLVSVGRGLVISGVLIYLLPAAAGADRIWWAMPITEAIVAVYVVWKMRKSA